MIVKQYTVSVQWGAGHHYFIWTGDDIDEGLEIRKKHQDVLDRRQKRGAKPQVYLWKKV